MADNFNRFVLANFGVLMKGLSVTGYVCTVAFIMAVVLGAVACLIRVYVPLLRIIAIAYIEFCRATPILVQLLWVNYVWPDLFGIPRTVEGAGIVALALQSSGYLAETFRAGLEGLAKGQTEAGLAIGLSRWQILYRIVMPQVGLLMAPSIVNQMAVIVKSSTLVSVIAVPDLTYQALKIVNQWFQPIEVLSSTAILYAATIFLISAIANRVSAYFQTKYGLVYNKRA
jgi:polar amino acid transport system permease protein